MKKYILPLLMLMSIQLWAQYSTPGNNGSYTLSDLVDMSDGAITTDSDQYYFNEDITLSVSDTLLIEEDITLQIGAGLLWTVEGVLKIDAPNMVFIQNKTSEDHFLGIRFDNSSSSYLRNVSFSNGGGIRLVESSMQIINCSIDNFNTEYSTGAINLFQSNPLIRDCTISNCAGPAIASGANSASSPQIINNVINFNVTENGNTPQINLGTSDGISPIVIDSNQVNGQYDNAGGIAVATLAGGDINAYVRYNEVSDNRYGIAFIDSNISGEVSYNYIDGNNIQNNPMLGGSGLNFQGGNTNNLIVHHNIIIDNLWGVTIQSSAQPNFGDGTDESPGHNQIYDNGNSGVTYALYNNTPDNIMAMNNYWGTETLEQTEDVIFHQVDDGSLGLVFFDPIWFSVGLSEIQKDPISFYPNPTQDDIIWNSMETTIEIIDINGKVIWEGLVSKNQKIDLEVESGVYFLKNGDQVSKFVVR